MASCVKMKIVGQFHQGREPDGGPGVVAEDEESRAEGPELGQRQPVHDRRHGVLADAEVQVLPAGAVGLEIAGAVEVQQWSCSTGRDRPSRRGTREYSAPARSAPCPRHRARRCPLASAGKTGKIAVPAGRQFAPLHLVDLGGQFGILGPVARRTASIHSAPRRRAARADAGREMLVDAVGHEELRVLGPAVAALGRAGSPRRPAARRGPRRCPACAASRSRCGCRE